MMDPFKQRTLAPMLLTERHASEPGEEWLNELKLDGIRCLAYLDGRETDLRNKRGMRLLLPFPELGGLCGRVRGKCVLDGELILPGSQGKPDFETLQARSMMSDPLRIRLLSQQLPASYVAFDILYQDGVDLTARPLLERKQILAASSTEGDHFALVRSVRGKAQALFQRTGELGLEGIVQKRWDSRYQPGRRSRDWVKVKHLIEEDFLALGHLAKSPAIASLVLGRPAGQGFSYQGHVTVSRAAAECFPTARACPFPTVPPGCENAVWYAAPHPCTVLYMERTRAGGMRQPRFKGFRSDA